MFDKWLAGFGVRHLASAPFCAWFRRPPGRDIRREKQRGQQHLPPSLCRSLFLALLRTRHIVSGRRSSLPSACCCRFEIEISPSRWILDTHVSLLLFSLSPFFSPFFFLFFFFNFVHSILDTGYWEGEDMRVPPCHDIGLFSKSSPPPPTPVFFPIWNF